MHTFLSRLNLFELFGNSEDISKTNQISQKQKVCLQQSLCFLFVLVVSLLMVLENS